jgi:type I restriction-modification system DNA methylase subunit
MTLRKIEDDNHQQLAGVLSAVDYNSETNLGTREHKNAILRDLLEDFINLDLRPSHIELKENQIPADVIGDASKYMIGEFAGMAGKKAGSLYTPAENRRAGGKKNSGWKPPWTNTTVLTGAYPPSAKATGLSSFT